jgi:dipeptidyl aminopeptidase/acylaminoacyl peptidase
MMTSVPTEPLQPFPTPQIIKLTIAESLPKTIQMWFPYYPKADVQPDLRGIKLDERSQKWEIVQLPIKINFPIPLTGPDPGPILVNFHISPNSRWLVADFAYGCSRLIDLLSGTSNSSVDNLSLAGCKFIAWLPNDPQSLIASSQEYSVRGFNKVNIETAQTEPVSFSDLVAEDDQIRAMAYSPDGKNKAVAVVKAAKANVRKNWLATVNLEGNEKRTLADINGGVSFVDDGLQWSPDGKNLIWIVEVWDRKGGSETQLWLADLGNGSTKELAVLGKSVRYNHPPAWSPDGSMIAVLKAGVNQEAGENIFLVNPKTGEEKQITHLVDRQFSHLQWLSDGKWLAFTVSAGEYGEIWMTNLDGSITFPFAGPTLPNAPYILIDVGK